jgi:hypothetical protein
MKREEIQKPWRNSKREISKNQSLMDLEIDALPDVIQLKEISDGALVAVFVNVPESESNRINRYQIYFEAKEELESTKQNHRSKSAYYKSISKLQTPKQNSTRKPSVLKL